MSVVILRGDAASLPLPDASVDAVVTDPPYGLADFSAADVAAVIGAWVTGERQAMPDGKGFMGRGWDRFVPPPAAWDECLRVLKPGGHLLAFAAPRTQDLMTLSIRLAGFEIRDGIDWIYGNGMPKGQDIAKSIDRRRDDRQKVLQVTAWLADARDEAGWASQQLNELFGFHKRGRASHWVSQSVAAGVPSLEQWAVLREALGFDDAEILPLVEELNGRKGLLGEDWARREVIGQAHRVRRPSDVQFAGLSDGAYDVTAPAADSAKQWDGWNTGLKPAHEPVILARKSTGFHSTVANVLLHGTGALNVDGCRVEHAGAADLAASKAKNPGRADTVTSGVYGASRPQQSVNDAGRWPPNVLLSTEAAAEMDRQSGVLASSGASRFFPVFRYEAKAGASERPRLADGTAWPTVKPVPLIRWLLRLVTPPGGTVLDMFCGTGTTGEAALIEGFSAILLDKDPQAIALTRVRLAKPVQPLMFGMADAGPIRALGVPKPPPVPEGQGSLFDDREVS